MATKYARNCNDCGEETMVNAKVLTKVDEVVCEDCNISNSVNKNATF